MRNWKFVLPVAIAVLAIAVGLFFYSHHGTALTENDTLVLADFENQTGDPIFDDTLKQALRVKLNESPFFNLVSDAELRTTLKVIGQPTTARLSAEIARTACGRLRARAVLRGSISALPGRTAMWKWLSIL